MADEPGGAVRVERRDHRREDAAEAHAVAGEALRHYWIGLNGSGLALLSPAGGPCAGGGGGCSAAAGSSAAGGGGGSSAAGGDAGSSAAGGAAAGGGVAA